MLSLQSGTLGQPSVSWPNTSLTPLLAKTGAGDCLKTGMGYSSATGGGNLSPATCPCFFPEDLLLPDA